MPSYCFQDCATPGDTLVTHAGVLSVWIEGRQATSKGPRRAVVELSPADARKLSAALLLMADEIEAERNPA